MESSFQNYYGEGTASAVSFFLSHIKGVNIKVIERRKTYDYYERGRNHH